MQQVRGEAAHKDPRAVNRLIGLLESGVSPEEAAKKMEFEAEKAALEEVEGPDEEETFTDEIKIISQALAFRKAEPDDLMEVMRLLNAAYSVETSDGEESFRRGDGMSVEVLISLFDDKSYEWLVVEAPNGREAVKDGTLLGVCVYSTDGVSRRNGEIEGKLGSIRILAVLPQFHGYMIGLRLLKRVESNMFKAGCVRSMACIPSVRATLEEWFEHRGYKLAGMTAYPAAAADHDVREEFDIDDSEAAPEGSTEKRHLRLLHFMRKLEVTAPTSVAESKRGTGPNSAEANGAGGTDEYEPATVLRLAGDVREGDAQQQQAGVYVPGKMHLPPHWRHAAPQPAAPTTTTRMVGGATDAQVRIALRPEEETASASKGGAAPRANEEEIPLD